MNFDQGKPVRVRIAYSKLGRAAFRGHLDLVRLLPRIFRRLDPSHVLLARFPSEAGDDLWAGTAARRGESRRIRGREAHRDAWSGRGARIRDRLPGRASRASSSRMRRPWAPTTRASARWSTRHATRWGCRASPSRRSVCPDIAGLSDLIASRRTDLFAWCATPRASSARSTWDTTCARSRSARRRTRWVEAGIGGRSRSLYLCRDDDEARAAPDQVKFSRCSSETPNCPRAWCVCSWARRAVSHASRGFARPASRLHADEHEGTEVDDEAVLSSDLGSADARVEPGE